MRIGNIRTAASRWGRRLALVLAVSGAIGAGETAGRAAEPTVDGLLASGLLTLPEPCRISREEFGVAPDENVWIDRIAEGVWIVTAQCEHHAYQSTDVALRVEQRDGALTAIVQAFPGWREGEETPQPYIAYQPWLTGLPGNIVDGRQDLFYRGRGIGDCGELVTYDLTGPVVRIAEYRAKFECDGNWQEPETWPPVPQQVLDEYAPAFTDRRAAGLMSAVMLEWPRADWMGHAIARGDLTGDGREEQWIGGSSRDWDTEQTTYHLVMEEGGRLRSWDIPVASETQFALCFPAAALSFESEDVLAIDDGGCDRLRIGWDAAADTIITSRN